MIMQQLKDKKKTPATAKRNVKGLIKFMSTAFSLVRRKISFRFLNK